MHRTNPSFTPTPQLSLELQQRIATRVASAWKRRGVKSYPFEDLYQDAVEVMHLAARSYVPEKGNLEGYLTRCCIYKLGDRLTRAIHPVTARSNDDVIHLRYLKTVRISNTGQEHSEAGGAVEYPNYDRLVWLTQLRERMLAVVGKDKLALAIALGQTDVRDVARDKEEARLLHQRVRKVKRRLMNDHTIYRMLKDA